MVRILQLEKVQENQELKSYIPEFSCDIILQEDENTKLSTESEPQDY